MVVYFSIGDLVRYEKKLLKNESVYNLLKKHHSQKYILIKDSLLIGLIVGMFWISYISETVSSLVILAIGFGLMYFNVITVIRSIH